MRVPKLSTVASVVTILLGSFTLLGGGIYAALSTYNQHFYGELGMSGSDLGIDRTRLIEDTIGGTIVLVVVFPLLTAAVCGLTYLVFAELLPRLLAMLWRRAPLHNDSRLAKVRRRATSRKPVDWRVAIGTMTAITVVFVGTFAYALWVAAGEGAKDVRAGAQYSGEVFGGLLALDVHASAFRFTRLPANHRFDRGCVLYLGRAEGKLVLYDTQRDRPLPLDETSYAGNALPGGRGPAPRCESGNDTITSMLDGNEVEDVDAAPGVRLWAQRGRGSQPWTLLVRSGGRTRLVTTGRRPLWPDLGRNVHGALVVTYRRCGRATSPCELRARTIATGRSATIAAPQVHGCEPARGSRHLLVLAVVLSGRDCDAHSRGVWVRRDGRPWHRMPGSGAASGDLDTFGAAVAWVERRGPILRLRVDRRLAPRTVFEDDAGLGGTLTSIASVRLVPGGVMWSTAPAERGTTVLMSRRFGSSICRTHGVFPTGRDGAGHLAPEAADVLVGTPRGLAERRGAVLLDAGERMAADRSLTARSCPSWSGRGQPSASFS